MLPLESVTEQVTVEVPTEKACGDVTEHVGVSGAPVQGSFDAVTVKLTVAVVRPGSVNLVMLAGQVIVGATPELASNAPIST
jgi:hypothetical protein